MRRSWTRSGMLSVAHRGVAGEEGESGTLCVVECFLIEPVTLPSPLYTYIYLVLRSLTRNSVQFHAVNVTYPNKLSLIRANIKHARLLYKQRISNSSMTSSFGQTHTQRKMKTYSFTRKNHHPLCIFNGRHVLFICMCPLWMIGHSGAGWVSFLITSKYVFNANFQIKADKLPESERERRGDGRRETEFYSL